MRAILLTHYYPPEAGAPQRRWSVLARELSRRGVEVTVHTGFPHYPDGRILAPYSNRPWLVEHSDGVRVVRSAVAALPNRGFGPRLLDHAAFSVSALALSPIAGPAQVVVVESPPLFLAGAAVAYARVKGARLVVNVSDLWPESAVQLGALTRGRLIAAAHGLARFAYRHADAITVPTQGIHEVLERTPDAAGKVHHMPPSVDSAVFRSPSPRRSGPLRVLYAGTIALAQSVGTLVEAAGLAGPEVVRVTVAGGGALLDELRELVERDRIDNVQLLGSVASESIPALYERADVGAVLLRDLPVFHGALPTKLLEVLAAGRPVVLSAAGESARFVTDHGVGVVVPPEDPAALAQAFRELQAEDDERFMALSQAAVRCAVAHDRSKAAERWLRLLGRCA